MRWIVVLFTALCAFSTPSFAETYRCAAPSGAVVYQQSPCIGTGRTIDTTPNSFGEQTPSYDYQRPSYDNSPIWQPSAAFKRVDEERADMAACTGTKPTMDRVLGCRFEALCASENSDRTMKERSIPECVNKKLADVRNYAKAADDRMQAAKDAEEKLKRSPRPQLGMSTQQVRDSNLGQPTGIHRSEYPGTTFEHWEYGVTGPRLTFKDGVLSAIQR